CILTKVPFQEAIAGLNQLVLELPTERFVTLIAGLLDPSSHRLTLVSAGHIPALRYQQASGTVQEVGREETGLPLGIAEARYTAVTVEFQPGDCVVLITDGITEAMNARREQFGLERVATAMLDGPCTPSATALRLIEKVRVHSGGYEQHDDLT